MKLRHGKLLTNDRLALVRRYQERRRNTPPNPWDVHGKPQFFWRPYREWVDGFERFMCRGLEADTSGVEAPYGVASPREVAHATQADELSAGPWHDHAGLPPVAGVD